MMSYHAMTRLNGRHDAHTRPIHVRNCNGLSHDMRMFGLVASWLEANTRYVTTQPAIPRMENHTM